MPSKKNDKVFEFALGSNDGVGIIKFSMERKKVKGEMVITGVAPSLVKSYLKEKVINNMISAGNLILAFEHQSSHYYLIEHKVGILGGGAKEITMNWPHETCIIGACMAPDFHSTENSFILVRDNESIMLINTQSWNVSKLVEVGQGMTQYPDLQLFEVSEDSHDNISVYTVKGDTNGQLIKRTYSHLLKYCMHNASVKISNSQKHNL